MPPAKTLLCLMAAALAAASVVHAQDRIKMCGRELIRLAVSSCGNSRLRRSVPDSWAVTELDQHRDRGSAAEEHQASEAPQFNGGKDVRSPAPHWYPVSFRVRRAVGKISDICCEKGCSLKELIQFC
uniref:Insulin-like 3 n=1 Tax=Salarias fasciatus TaxID=181472 RepID=A0A672J1E4_SALFA